MLKLRRRRTPWPSASLSLRGPPEGGEPTLLLPNWEPSRLLPALMDMLAARRWPRWAAAWAQVRARRSPMSSSSWNEPVGGEPAPMLPMLVA